MSHFSHALTKEIELSGEQQAAWASRAGLSQAILSRYCSGQAKPEKNAMEKICSNRPDDVRTRLIIAFLEDQIPASCRHCISILANGGRVREADPAPAEIQKLDSKTKKAVLHIARIALDNKDAQDSIQSTARYLGCKI